ncbi:uncharacterized protein H6S33_005164 [Morchella sextelata]|uniref:uncharacterized protein n=1 Tax=Morchella sextelata TaxID=1174677 RepID=UPI001D04C37F|nr:uncharacterized protein H6S33_005164 [Morchella sextelata]KAH0605182.1 hypothetical protein H6S33_005164 [Morchella sextelata]
MLTLTNNNLGNSNLLNCTCRPVKRLPYAAISTSRQTLETTRQQLPERRPKAQITDSLHRMNLQIINPEYPRVLITTDPAYTCQNLSLDYESIHLTQTGPAGDSPEGLWSLLLPPPGLVEICQETSWDKPGSKSTVTRNLNVISGDADAQLKKSLRLFMSCTSLVLELTHSFQRHEDHFTAAHSHRFIITTKISRPIITLKPFLGETFCGSPAQQSESIKSVDASDSLVGRYPRKYVQRAPSLPQWRVISLPSSKTGKMNEQLATGASFTFPECQDHTRDRDFVCLRLGYGCRALIEVLCSEKCVVGKRMYPLVRCYQLFETIDLQGKMFQSSSVNLGGAVGARSSGGRKGREVFESLGNGRNSDLWKGADLSASRINRKWLLEQNTHELGSVRLIDIRFHREGAGPGYGTRGLSVICGDGGVGFGPISASDDVDRQKDESHHHGAFPPMCTLFLREKKVLGWGNNDVDILT